MTFPAEGVCAGHSSPFEYLKAAYFEPERDVVVWAPRGGGKTRLGAVATLLDLAHKPGISVRILGGSLEQSMKMWEHLMVDADRWLGGSMKGKRGSRGFALKNGSRVGVLTQSERAVRGLRVQKLRCDEVEMFDRGVWEAAQLVTKSIRGRGSGFGVQDEEGKIRVRGAVEALSTCHSAGGMMEGLIENAEGRGARVIKWCLMEVLERCPAERVCGSCPLWEECGGRAKRVCDGFVSIDDAIGMKRRVSRETWESEMLCLRPSRRGAVFATFDVGRHVREEMPAAAGSEAGGSVTLMGERRAGLYLGIDFGFRNPFVCLWVWRDRWGRSFVIDEYVKAEVELDRHLAEIRSRVRWGEVRRVGCDPAGSARNEQTGESSVNRLRAAGFKVACRGSLIQDGLEMIRAGLCSGTGEATLFIHPRCKQLVQAMRTYRYGEGRAETPVKDGADHLVDALRYYFVTRDGGEVIVGRY
jgi:hypothetical protein